jgi:hypothetical protein
MTSEAGTATVSTIEFRCVIRSCAARRQIAARLAVYQQIAADLA